MPTKRKKEENKRRSDRLEKKDTFVEKMQREFSINASRSFPENDYIIMNTAFVQRDDITFNKDPETVMPIKQEGIPGDNATGLQGELRAVEDFCSSVLMCAANESCHANKMSEISMRTGIIIKPVWSWIRKTAVDVNLDPSTAHPKLIISGDQKSVRLGKNRQTFPENSKRYDHVVNVLGKESFSSGRHYWEVEVKHKTDWTLGVAKGTVSRKGTLLIRPDTGFWTIILKDGMYKANSESPVLLSLRETPQKVGVYVDYGRGQVSFYSVDSRTHIFSFSGYNFTEELHPLLRPGLTDYGKNTSPLIITPIDVHQK
nr:pyrin-like [Paramormyrops kingsleyae]